MNRINYIYYIVCSMLFTIPAASAQTFDVIEKRNFWNEGRNATGLRMDSVTVSYAEGYGRIENGDFRDYSQAERQWSAGAIAKTITHTEKYSMAGSFSFDNTSGKNMSGSMFIHPGYYPVDVIEFTPGRKDLQTYAFTGSISSDIAAHWRIGGTIDFKSSNYSKRKDLRHTNYRLDMTIAPSVMYYDDTKAFGLSYIFGKNTETISAEVIGTADNSYYAFLDKGLMYGAYEVWSGGGIHLSETGISGFPVKEITHGAALQFQYKRLYIDMEYTYSSGSIGEKQTIWFEFPTHRIKSNIGFSFGSAQRLHLIKVKSEWSHQVNNENVLSKQTNNGITITHKYGQNRIFERNVFSLNPQYDYLGRNLELTAGFRISTMERMATQMFPYVMSQTMTNYKAYAAGIWHTGKFDIKSGIYFSSGNFTDKQRTLESDNEPGQKPYHLTTNNDILNEYLTASRIGVDLAVRYNFYKGMYAELAAGIEHGFDLKYIKGSDRWFETLKFGYNF